MKSCMENSDNWPLSSRLSKSTYKIYALKQSMCKMHFSNLQVPTQTTWWLKNRLNAPNVDRFLTLGIWTPSALHCDICQNQNAPFVFPCFEESVRPLENKTICISNLSTFHTIQCLKCRDIFNLLNVGPTFIFLILWVSLSVSSLIMNQFPTAGHKNHTKQTNA